MASYLSILSQTRADRLYIEDQLEPLHSFDCISKNWKALFFFFFLIVIFPSIKFVCVSHFLKWRPKASCLGEMCCELCTRRSTNIQLAKSWKTRDEKNLFTSLLPPGHSKLKENKLIILWLRVNFFAILIFCGWSCQSTEEIGSVFAATAACWNVAN